MFPQLPRKLLPLRPLFGKSRLLLMRPSYGFSSHINRGRFTDHEVNKSNTFTSCDLKKKYLSNSKPHQLLNIGRTIHTSGSLDQDSIPKSRALTLIKELKEVKHSPAPALALGLSGLIPFVAAPVYMILMNTFSPFITFAQVAYGATILSFLGGVRWGLTLPEDSVVKPDWKNLGYSVTPSLVAWVGLLLPEPLSILTLMGGLGAAAYFDTTLYGYPMWFKGLRFVLSFFAVLSLWTTFMCRYLVSSKEDKKVEVDEQ